MRHHSAIGIDATLYMLHAYHGIPLPIQTPKGTTDEQLQGLPKAETQEEGQAVTAPKPGLE